jgi:CheY-like chemotaxis protein
MRTVHPNSTLPTILVADDHAIFAETLSNYLESNADLVLFASKRHLGQSQTLRADCGILGISPVAKDRVTS